MDERMNPELDQMNDIQQPHEPGQTNPAEQLHEPEQTNPTGQPRGFAQTGAAEQQSGYQGTQASSDRAPKPFIIDGTYSEQPQYRQTTYGSYAFGSRVEPNGTKHGQGKAPQPRQPKKKTAAARISGFVAKACLFGLLAGGTMVGVNQAASYLLPVKSGKASVSLPSVASGTALSHGESSDTASTQKSAVVAVSQSAMASLVSISNKATVEQQTLIGAVQREAVSNGTGIIVGENDKELLIATNYHVISDSKQLEVRFINEKTAKAELKGGDEDMDLAVIAVAKSGMDEETLAAIKIASLGSSLKSKVGEQVVAIGNALGYGQSVTTGIISAFRTMSFGEKNSQRSNGTENSEQKQWIQTDAAINPGNSGGALMNMNGEVIGINTVKVRSELVEGMGYAIPIDQAMPILQELMNRETRTKVDVADRGYLGITGIGVSADAQSMYKIPAGIYITRIQQSAAADKAGLEEGDIIVKIGDAKISSMTELKNELAYYKVGDKVKMKIQKRSDNGYAEQEVEVSLTTKDKAGVE
ncbi:MAG: trypsin-like peptidase domain-containing protein [Lachnospiraceae bacterium]|nr:trypsin-like peptidase domain-containing protein [Lachnospiraceae bacterium]